MSGRHFRARSFRGNEPGWLAPSATNLRTYGRHRDAAPGLFERATVCVNTLCTRAGE